MSAVAWLRPVADRYGAPVRTSKCGRFVITKHQWWAPIACVSYRLHSIPFAEYVAETDTLAEAREVADGMIEEES